MSQYGKRERKSSRESIKGGAGDFPGERSTGVSVWASVIRRRTVNGILPLSLLSPLACYSCPVVNSGRASSLLCPFPLSLSLSPLSILTTPMQPCSPCPSLSLQHVTLAAARDAGWSGGGRYGAKVPEWADRAHPPLVCSPSSCPSLSLQPFALVARGRRVE